MYLELTEHQCKTLINLLHPFAHAEPHTKDEEAIKQQEDVKNIYDKIQLHMEYFPMDG